MSAGLADYEFGNAIDVACDDSRLRLALVHDRAHDPAALVSILARARLPPNGGVLPVPHVSRLAMCPPVAIVIAADLARADGMALVRSLHDRLPDARIVVVARDARGLLVRQALNAGADGFVSEQGAADELAPAVKAVVAGLVCVPRHARRLVAKPTFSHREKEVLALMVAGMTNRQIADRLYLAESTVKSHIASAFAKLGVRSRKDAAAVLLDPAEGLAATAMPPDTGRAVDLRASGQTATVLVAPSTTDTSPPAR